MAVANLLNITRATQSPPAYLLLAAANMKAEEWENALTVLDILHGIEPDLPEANLLKGFVHGYFNRFGEGKSCLQAAVKKAPDFGSRWIALIEMAMAEGSNHEAARFLTEALRADPHHMDLLRSQLGLLLDQPSRPRNERLPSPCQVEVLMQGDYPMKENDPGIRIYLREIGRIPLLTRDQEIQLARRIRRGDKKARKQMIEANLRLVVKIACEYEPEIAPSRSDLGRQYRLGESG